jgi:hypothetical protein
MSEKKSKVNAKELLEKIKTSINEYDSIKKSKASFINKFINSEINKIQLKREEEMNLMDKHYESMIDELRVFGHDILHNLSNIEAPDQSFEEMRNEMKDYDQFITSFGSFSKAIEGEMLKSSKQIDNILADYKASILKNKVPQFNTERFHEHNRRRYFGTLVIKDNSKFDSNIIRSISESKHLMRLCQFDNTDSFELLYRATDHGFRARDFHTKCDNIPNTLTIIRSKSDMIFGAYTTAQWDTSNRFKHSDESFLFSLVNENGHPVKLFCVDYNSAIYCGYNFGPTFGAGHDLLVTNNSNTNEQSFLVIGKNKFHFLATEIEVFRRKI